LGNLDLILRYAISAAYVVLTAYTVRDWIRNRKRAQALVALSICLLTAVTLLNDLDIEMGHSARLVTILIVFTFLGAGYALLLLRNAFVPLKPRTLRILTAVLAVTALLGIFLSAPNRPGIKPSLAEQVYTTAYGLIWIACVAEPLVRFYRSARGRAAVQRARLRALSLGYAGIILVLIVNIGALLAAGQPGVQLVIDLVSLGIVPMLYASFAPPRWLRVVWRQHEEQALSRGTQDLLLASPDAETLADRALDWAIRLVGADGGFIAEAGEKMLATRGLEPAEAAALAGALASRPERGLVRVGPDRTAIALPLPLKNGDGTMAVVTGPFTPLFSLDEVERLRQYAVATTSAIDRVLLVEAMRQSTAELARSNRALEEFAYVASHDLQEPLRTLAGYVQLLRRRYQGKLDGDADEFIEFASDGAVRMQALVNDLLAYSRAGAHGAEFRETDCENVLRDALSNLRAAIEESGAHVTHNRLPTLMGDPAQITQLFQNLIANAIKFRGSEQPRIQVGAEPEERGWRFEVRDNGIGIPPEHRERVFSLFQRLHTREEYPGTGIGLALCRRIVERHHGTIWVESLPGQGSRFFFTLSGRGGG
jgi:signal transduction histidine kinase